MNIRALILCAVVFVMACSGAQDESVHDGRGPSEPASGGGARDDEPAVESMEGTITRERLAAILGRSVGDFLRNVEVEPEVEGGAFVGHRIVSLPEQPAWFDVRRGDVVTAINGMPLERPEDAQRVWETLQIASEVRIDLLRNGERRSVRVPIEEGEGPAEGAPADDAPAPTPPPVGPEE